MINKTRRHKGTQGAQFSKLKLNIQNRKDWSILSHYVFVLCISSLIMHVRKVKGKIFDILNWNCKSTSFQISLDIWRLHNSRLLLIIFVASEDCFFKVCIASSETMLLCSKIQVPGDAKVSTSSVLDNSSKT